MLDILFGWSKASKCKKVIKRARCRLKLLMNKRRAIARQSREDVAELIKSGHQESAVNRVEHLIKDETLSAAYELLDHFCEFILTQLSYIRRHKDCPNDINEAVSSLIFASARIGDLPELFVIRKLFGRRYGQKFATTAVELLPGNLVNKQLIESLSLKSVLDDVKYRVVDEIARDHCLQPELLAIEYYPDWQQIQEREIKGYQVGQDGGPINARIAGAEMHDSEVEEIQREIVCVDSPVKLLFKPISSCFLRESNVADASAIISTVQKYLPYIQRFPLQKMEKVLNISELLPSSKDTRGSVAYGDDIEESQFSASRNGSFHDEKTRLDYDHQSDVDKMESESHKSSTRSSRKRNGSMHEKRTRRRSASLENQCVTDIGCSIYYHKPSRNASSHRTCSRYRLKHQNPSIEVPQAGYAHKRLKHHNSSKMERVNACSLNHPCYCSVHDENRHCLKELQVNPNIGITKPICNEESNKGMEIVSAPGRVVYNVFTYPDCKKTEKNENGKPSLAYARAVTMPPERQRTAREKMVRMYSSPPEYPRHVHPKLPDYDDLAAKFIALKREHLHNKVITVDTQKLKG